MFRLSRLDCPRGLELGILDCPVGGHRLALANASWRWRGGGVAGRPRRAWPRRGETWPSPRLASGSELRTPRAHGGQLDLRGPLQGLGEALWAGQASIGPLEAGAPGQALHASDWEGVLGGPREVPGRS